MNVKTTFSSIGIVMISASTLLGTTVFPVTRTCPLDGTKFGTYELGSYNTFGGVGLDFDGSRPLMMPQCPECSLPLYKRNFTKEETTRLKNLVTSERFKKEASGKSSHFAFGVLKELQNKPAHDIAWTYLQASWEYGYDTNTQTYAEIAKRAITFFDASAKDFKDGDMKDKKHAEACFAALYFPVELSRRIGDFDEASRRLEKSAPILADSPVDEIAEILEYQRKLIARKNSAPHQIGDWEAERPPPVADDVIKYLRYHYDHAEKKVEWLPVSEEDGKAILSCLSNFKKFKQWKWLDSDNEQVLNPLPSDSNMYVVQKDGSTNGFWFVDSNVIYRRVRGEGRFVIPIEERTKLARIFAKWQGLEITQIDLTKFPLEYKITAGDTLSGVANKFYGNAAKWQLIYEANKASITNPDRLANGMSITIPKPE